MAESAKQPSLKQQDKVLTPPVSPGLQTPHSPVLSQADTVVNDHDVKKQDFESPSTPTHAEPEKHYAKTLRLTSDQLKQLNLKKGMNTMTYTVQSSYSGVAVVTSRIFLWDSDYQVVISDIDGTITKYVYISNFSVLVFTCSLIAAAVVLVQRSDALGHVFTMIGRDWTHPGVAKLYTDIARNGYKFMYLTSRAIGQADVTKEYLRGISQNGFTLPEGPVIMSPDRLLTSLHRYVRIIIIVSIKSFLNSMVSTIFCSFLFSEVVLRKPEVFKMACLRDIKNLFLDRNPFYAGFGNRLTDGLSYRSVEIPSSRIFTIDSYGNVKLELLELAGYTSSCAFVPLHRLPSERMLIFVYRYIAMTNLVNETFPPVQRDTQPAFNDFNYWRVALPEVELPDFAPPSPALSARSDSSRMSVFRIGAIAGTLSKRASRNNIKSDTASGSGTKSPLSTSPRSTSPLPAIYRSDDEEEDEVDEDDGDNGVNRQNQDRKNDKNKFRARHDSMPGSFDNESYLEQVRESLELEREKRDTQANGETVEDDEEDQEEADGDSLNNSMLEEDDDLPDMDFGNVPVSHTCPHFEY